MLSTLPEARSALALRTIAPRLSISTWVAIAWARRGELTLVQAK
jgi:hypothetical protein